MARPPLEPRDRAAKIRLVLLDVDGVLTDGRLYMAPDGMETKAFNARDGLGIRLGQRGGLTFGLVSGRASATVATRAAELDIAEVHQGIGDKAARVRDILERTGFSAIETAFVGDDLVDVPVMRMVGFSASPADAAPETRAAAHLVTAANGGHGAVREVIDYVLQATGNWDSVTGRFLREG